MKKISITELRASVTGYIKWHKLQTGDIDSVSKFTKHYYTAKEYYDMYKTAGGKSTFQQLYKSVKIKKY